MSMKQNQLMKVLLLIIIALSGIGYIIFAVGFGLVYTRLSSSGAFLPVVLGHSAWEDFMSPMWLFAMSAIPLYPVLLARILVPEGLSRQILQSVLAVVSVFYIMGAGTTFLMGIVLSLDNHSLMILLKLERTQTVPLFGGAITSVFFYVVVMFLLPLTELRRKTKYYYELVESTK